MPRDPRIDHVSAPLALVLTFLALSIGGAGLAAITSQRVHAAVSAAVAPTAPGRLAAVARLRAANPAVQAVRAPAPAPAPVAPPAKPPLVFGPGPAWPQLPLQGMAAGMLVDIDTHQVLWAYNAHAPHPTASLGKIFTVMVALDHAQLDDVVTVPPGGEDDNPNDSVMGLHVGDRVTVRDLIDGIWLASGDDAAETLARSFIPRDQFIAEMNAKAAALGLTDTHLANPSGLDDPAQYSSPYDLAVAASWLELHYADAFVLAGQGVVPLGPNSGHPEDLTLHALNKLVTSYNDSGHAYPGIDGLKTGWTDHAGGCVIATARRHGQHLVAVVMGDNWFFSDAAALLDYGFAIER